MIYSNTGGYSILSGAAQGNGTALDFRARQNHIIFQTVSGNSAVISYQVAPRESGPWVTYLTVTATVGTTAQHNVSGFYPYVRASLDKVASAAGGSAMAHCEMIPGVA